MLAWTAGQAGAVLVLAGNLTWLNGIEVAGTDAPHSFYMGWGAMDEIWSVLLRWPVWLLEKSLRGKALGAPYRMLWCSSCCRMCSTGCCSTSGVVLALEHPLRADTTKTFPRAKPACGKCREKGFASKPSCWSRLRPWLRGSQSLWLLEGYARLAVVFAQGNAYSCYNYAFCNSPL